MTNAYIANAAINVLSAFLSNSGAEIAKSIGKDVYEKIKHAFKNDEDKQILHKLEAEPFSIPNQEKLSHLLIAKFNENNFLPEILISLHINASNTYILEKVLHSNLQIRQRLDSLYPRWINAGCDKKGEYQNQIEELEAQLLFLEEKFLKILHDSARRNLKNSYVDI